MALPVPPATINALGVAPLLPYWARIGEPEVTRPLARPWRVCRMRTRRRAPRTSWRLSATCTRWASPRCSPCLWLPVRGERVGHQSVTTCAPDVGPADPSLNIVEFDQAGMNLPRCGARVCAVAASRLWARCAWCVQSRHVQHVAAGHHQVAPGLQRAHQSHGMAARLLPRRAHCVATCWCSSS